MSIQKTCESIRKRITSIKKRNLIQRLKDSAESTQIPSKKEIEETLGINAKKLPAKIYLDLLKVLVEDSKQRHGDGSSMKLLSTLLETLYQNKKMILSSSCDLIKSLPAILSEDTGALLEEIDRIDKLELIDSDVDKINSMSAEEMLADKIVENLKLARLGSSLLNSIIESDIAKVMKEEQKLPKNLSGLKESFRTAPDKIMMLFTLSSKSTKALINFLKNEPDKISCSDSSLACELHSRGACDLLDNTLSD